MRLTTEPYALQVARWPAVGCQILAQYDESTTVVYQAYQPSIGRFAAARQTFAGGGFSFNRMSWIKPNFLWMMERCGWGTKPGQEIVLAIWLQRAGFDAILAEAVHSSFRPAVYGDTETWKRAVATSSVRLQWDPDHDPSGAPVARRAIQLGLRGEFLIRYAREWIVEIEEITPFVREQHAIAQVGEYSRLVTPRERVYPVEPSTARKLELDMEEGDNP